MAKPRGNYTDSIHKIDGTLVSLPKRKVRHIAIMPSTSCGELKALFSAGLITRHTTIQCYEDSSRPGKQASFEDMRIAVITLLMRKGWSLRTVKKNVQFYDADITRNCVNDARKWGKLLDWVYLDYCGVVKIDALMILHDDWNGGQFSKDAEISVTSCHKLRAAIRMEPFLLSLGKYGSKVGAYARTVKRIPEKMESLIIGSQVGIAYALPFGASVVESLSYARGMTTTRFARDNSPTRPHGLKMTFEQRAKVTGIRQSRRPKPSRRPKEYQSLSTAEWTWSYDNPTGRRYT